MSNNKNKKIDRINTYFNKNNNTTHMPGYRPSQAMPGTQFRWT